MNVKLRKIPDQVIVITGASSGIGLATAKLAAKQRATVMLSSRNGDELERLCSELRAEGGDVDWFACDVAEADQVRALADATVARFGRIDTWVNNAGVSIYGRLTETPLEEKRRLFDVNFWGVVHGCRAAIPHLSRDGGALINLGSTLSERAIPLQGIYCASKHAVKAYTDSLRMELEADKIRISVSLIKPAAINTPYTEHARNRLEAGVPDLPPPVYEPEVAARAILACAETPTRDVFVGGGGKLFSLMEHFAPRLTDLYMERTLFKQQVASSEGPRPQQDALFTHPELEGNVHGQRDHHNAKSSLYTTMSLNPVKTIAVIAAGVGVAAWTLLNRRLAPPASKPANDAQSEMFGARAGNESSANIDNTTTAPAT